MADRGGGLPARTLSRPTGTDLLTVAACTFHARMLSMPVHCFLTEYRRCVIFYEMEGIAP